MKSLVVIITILIGLFVWSPFIIYWNSFDSFDRQYSFKKHMDRCAESYRDGNTIDGTLYIEEDYNYGYDIGAEWCIKNLESCKSEYK